MSTSYHPQMDGPIEVMNKTLEDYLKAFTRDGQDRWDEMLIMAEFAMNNAVKYVNRRDALLPELWGTFPDSKCPGVQYSSDTSEHTSPRL